jgi:phosphoribosylaminoimidazole-succinocarboxamide synthase
LSFIAERVNVGRSGFRSKQFVRDWLTETSWDKASNPPELPADVVAKTREKYIDAYERITGKEFAWK